MTPPSRVKESQVPISYIRNFIPGLAQLLYAFLPLLRKGVVFAWGEAQCSAFQKLKQYLVTPQVLRPLIGGGGWGLYTYTQHLPTWRYDPYWCKTWKMTIFYEYEGK